MRRLVMLCLALLLASCASVPLGTLWKLRNVDGETLVSLDPAELRAAVALRPHHPIQPDSVKLGVGLTRKDGRPESYAFALVPTREPGPTLAGWTYSQWRLDAAGQREFQAMQRSLEQAGGDFKATYSGVDFSVEFKPEFGATPPAALRLSVQLRLALQEGYFLLVDDAEISVTGG